MKKTKMHTAIGGTCLIIGVGGIAGWCETEKGFLLSIAMLLIGSVFAYLSVADDEKEPNQLANGIGSKNSNNVIVSQEGLKMAKNKKIINNLDNVNVPRLEYRELVSIRSRVEGMVDFAINHENATLDDCLLILGVKREEISNVG